jgi:hypothetical protein
MTGCGGGALGAPLWVALLSVLSKGQGIEWNDLSSSDRPPSRSDLIPYNKIGWVHGDLGELVYGLHTSESRRALQRHIGNGGGVVELKKPCASFGCSVLTLCVSGCVSLDRPPLGGPSGVFLAMKQVGSMG